MIVRKCDICGAIIEDPNDGVFDCELPIEIKEDCYSGGKDYVKFSYFLRYDRQKKDVCVNCAKKIIFLIDKIKEGNIE